MLMLLTIAAAAAQPSPPEATARAQATIRIVSAVRLRVGAARSEDGRPVERATIRSHDGSLQPAMLVQFE